VSVTFIIKLLTGKSITYYKSRFCSYSYKCCPFHFQVDELEKLRYQNQELRRQLEREEERLKLLDQLQVDNDRMRCQISKMKEVQKSFLDDSQIQNLEEGRTSN